MKRTIIAAVIGLACGAALAGQGEHPSHPVHPPHPSHPGGTTSSTSSATLGSVQGAGIISVVPQTNVNPTQNTYANPNASAFTALTTGPQGNLTIGGAGLGNTFVPRQAPSVSGVDVPATPRSCRLFFSLFGSSSGGAGGGGIPLGNDQTCLSWNQIEIMAEVNSYSGDKPVFGLSDMRRAACKIEGMGEMEGCKAVTAARVEREAP